MYCWNCGEKLDDNAKFCRKCGADLTEPHQSDNFDEMYSDETIILPEAAEISSEAAEMSPDPYEIPSRNDEMPSENEGMAAGNDGTAPKKNGGRLREKGMMGLTVAAGAAVAAAVVAVIFFVQGGVKENRLEEYMDIGYSFMEDGNYEEAAAAFESALGVDPKSKEAQEMLTQAYRGTDPEELEVASAAGGPDDTQNIIGYAENPVSNSTSSVSTVDPDSKTTNPDTTPTSNSKTDSNPVNPGTETVNPGTEPVDPENDSVNSGTESVTPDPEPAKEELEVVTLPAGEEENVKDLIQTFSVSTASLLEDWYDDSTDSGDYFEYEAFDVGQPYAIAALSLVQTYDDDIYDTDEEYVYYDTQMCSVRDLTGQQLEDAGDETYICMDESAEEAYSVCVYNLFGDEYPLEEFAEYEYDGDLGVVVRQDDEGQFYLKVMDEMAENSENVEVEIEQVVTAEDDSDAAGTYGVLAKLAETGNPNSIYHIRCWVDPDDTSSYGYTIKKMIPAGEGEDPDPEFVVEEPEDASDEDENDINFEPLSPEEEFTDEDPDLTEEIVEQPAEETEEDEDTEEPEEDEDTEEPEEDQEDEEADEVIMEGSGEMEYIGPDPAASSNSSSQETQSKKR